jgi:hypothetical protein
LRIYLSIARDIVTEDLGDDEAQLVQSHFVEQRQQHPTISADTLHLWLVMLRLIANSFGSSAMTAEHWQLVCQLEQARVSWLARTTSSNANTSHDSSNSTTANNNPINNN